MLIYQVSIILLGIILIILRVFFQSVANVDSTVVIVYFMLYIPIVGKYLKSAKFLGSEFMFKEEIEKAKEYIEISNKKVSEDCIDKANGKKELQNFETFDFSIAEQIFETDHILALAALRIEIEKKLRMAYNFLFEYSEYIPLNVLINKFSEGRFFHKEQLNALKQIISICNKAIHGIEIKFNEAKEIMDLAKELNISFPAGYSMNIMPNSNYKQNGFICEFEHCIERMPLPTDNDINDACPIFGHFCPGGQVFVQRCRSAKGANKK